VKVLAQSINVGVRGDFVLGGRSRGLTRHKSGFLSPNDAEATSVPPEETCDIDFDWPVKFRFSLNILSVCAYSTRWDLSPTTKGV